MWRVIPGVIDKTAVRAFKYGACGGLAIALHDATGWPIIAIECGGLNLHYMVRDPAGRLIDIEGARTAADITLEYEVEADDGNVTLAETARDTVWAWYQDEAGMPVPMNVVHTIATALLGVL